jgi:Tol biopolymer transport system component
MQAMLFTRLKVAAVCGLALGVACLAVWAVLPKASAQEAVKQATVPLAPGEKPGGAGRPQRAAKPAGPGTLLLARKGGFIALTPEGKEGAELALPKGTRTAFQGRLSPDGTRAAYLVTAGRAPRPPVREGEEPEPWPFQVVIRKLGAPEASAVVDLRAHRLSLTWAPDGKRLLVTSETGPQASRLFENVLLDPATGKTEPLDLPEGVSVLDWSRDGKTFLVVDRHDKKYRLGLAAKGEKEVRVLTELKGRFRDNVGRFSPDGSRILYTDADLADKDAYKWGLSSKPYLLDVASRKRELLSDFPLNAQALGVAWAPDGKRIAYTWKQLHREMLKKDSLDLNDMRTATEAFLVVADPSGKNAQTVASGRVESAINVIFGSIDWR